MIYLSACAPARSPRGRSLSKIAEKEPFSIPMPHLINKLARQVMRCYPFPRGQGRIIDRTALKRLRFEESTLVVPTTDGFEIKVFPNDLIGRQLYLTGQFDRTIVQVLLAQSHAKDCILDIGANIGYVACAMLAGVKDSRVIAVEPQENCFQLLCENLARVSNDRGKALKVAVSDRSGVAFLEYRQGNLGATRIKAAEGGAEASNTVNVVTGPELMEMSGLEKLDLVKIDVEGHEEAVLTSMAPVIERHRPRAILFEHYGELVDASVGIRHLLDQLGYEILGVKKKLLSWGLMPMEQMKASGRWAHDYLARPVEKRA